MKYLTILGVAILVFIADRTLRKVHEINESINQIYVAELERRLNG